ncbi:MAG: YbhB/YbcL family Raf kinase inhibitor-like protein [Aureliella sp.]
MKLASTAFTEGHAIPVDYTGDGANTSPPLTWTEQPKGTASFALICEDPDAPRGIWTHWVLFNLPAATHQLAKGVPHDAKLAGGALQGKNDFGKIGYGGPAPPPGKPHRYFFRLYALSSLLKLQAGASRKEVLDAMKGHVLGETHLMGTYKR